MKDEIFYDTNILYYAYDLSEPEKRKTCKVLISKVFMGDTKGVISSQILVELYNALTRKLGVKPDTAKVIVDSFITSTNWLKINYNYLTVKAALDTSKAFRAPFLDSLIAETMKENGITQITTENEKDFARIPGIKIKNPIRFQD
jgi:Predicted nucleic-acid-binding protein, contains PIN domain